MTPAVRPEPVRNAAAVAATITTVVGLVLTILVVTHVLTPDDSATLGPALATALPALVGAVSAVVAALRARLKVTPLSDPRDATGQPLLTAGILPPSPPAEPGYVARPQTPGVADHAAPEEPQPGAGADA